jgi:hypothetical protein
VVYPLNGFAGSKDGAFGLREGQSGTCDVRPASIGWENALELAVTALKETSANMPFDFCQDAGHTGLAQPDLPGGTMKVQLLGKSNYCAEIVKVQRRTATHRKIASFERLAPSISILPKASKFSTERSPFPQFSSDCTLLSSLIPLAKWLLNWCDAF